jgi:quercetin dioxygenase-like cupin family protein
MEIKRNEATINRPEGDRVIDAPFVFTDITEFVEQLRSEDALKKNGRNGITVFKSTGITQVITILSACETIKENEVEGFVTIQVIEGTANFTTSEGDIPVKRNQMISLHPHVVHSFKATTEVVILLTTFSLV